MTSKLLQFGVGFLIPAYNPSKNMVGVVENLKRLIAEKGLKAELFPIVIVDDGCPQNSGRLAKEIAKKFTNVKNLI